MFHSYSLQKIKDELKEGIALPKCQKCGCMKETLNLIKSSLTSSDNKELSILGQEVEIWDAQMDQIKYPCLGCEHCYPAVAMNILNQEFPDLISHQTLNCGFEVKEHAWPAVAGEYSFFCDGKDPSCPVAVTTLASVNLAEELSKFRTPELCMVGKTETENIGIDKIVKNIVTNPTIKILIVVGREPKGHLTGNTLMALWKNGVDENRRVINAQGKRPILKNVTREEIDTFRQQIKAIDLIGCEDVETITKKIKEVTLEDPMPSCHCHEAKKGTKYENVSPVAAIEVKPITKVEMDKAGYFVIIPRHDTKTIIVEHYSYDNTLLRTIEGKAARSIYGTIIENQWVTLLSHAAYLGKELEKAELSIQQGVKYIQDGA